MQQAVRHGFNPFKTPGINMASSAGLASAFGISAEESFQEWRQRLLADTTDWGLCGACADAFHKAIKKANITSNITTQVRSQMPTTKPHKVILAVRIMWVLWAVFALGGTVANWKAYSKANIGLSALVPILLVLTLLLLVVRAVSVGRNWARIIYSLFLCFGILSLVADLGRFGQVTAPILAPAIFFAAVCAIIFYLLFHPTSSSWFRGTH